MASSSARVAQWVASRRGPVLGVARRTLATSQSFSSFEYPLRTEAPIVTRTTAKDAAANAAASLSTVEAPNVNKSHLSDPTTVTATSTTTTTSTSQEQDEQLRQLQKQTLTTKLLGSQAISTHVPDYIPPNVPSDQLQVPHTHLTTLANGVRVVSQETYGQVCTIGVLADVGSRHERHTGTAHLMELLAFQSTSQYSSPLDILEQLQDWGGTSFANASREQMLYCLDILRPNVQQGMQLLQQVVLEPLYLPEEVQDCKKAMEFQAMDVLPESNLGECLQEAAYGTDQQLGKRHYCPSDALPELTPEVVRDFSNTYIRQNPKGLVVAGAGIGHEELTDMANQHFGHLTQASDTPHSIPSIYRGGEAKLEVPSVDGFTRIAIAFEVGGWHSQDLVPTCVLQTLLGGGNSFSAGGPGKGMYSRLYRQVLNRYYWAESAEAFTAFHNESGLFGISGSSDPRKSRDVTRVMSDHFLKLAVDLVTDEEFDRARNMLKCNVLTQLESRLVLFEDMGRQVLTYGHREDTATMCNKIDSVTKEELRTLVQRAVQQPPTLAAVGADLAQVPSHEELTSWFQ